MRRPKHQIPPHQFVPHFRQESAVGIETLRYPGGAYASVCNTINCGFIMLQRVASWKVMNPMRQPLTEQGTT